MKSSQRDTIGRYEVRRKLTEGGMAEVFLAYDPLVGREVAIKVIHSRMADDSMLHQRFNQEVKAVVALEHSAIVPLYDFGEADDKPFFVMRYMPGGSLYDRLVKQTPTLAESNRILQRMASALDAAHKKGIIHRDIKPGNILFDTYGEAFVGDFGIAKLVQEGTNVMTSATGMVGGTPKYMSPEQCRGITDIDGRTDVYAVGIVLFEMLTGSPPYNADTPMGYLYLHLNQPPPPLWSSRPDLPSALDIVMNRALAKDRERRYSTVGELAEAFSDAISGASTISTATAGSNSADPSAPTIAKSPTPTPRSRSSAEPPSSPATPESYAETIMSPKAAARLNSNPPASGGQDTLSDQGENLNTAPTPSANPQANVETIIANKNAAPATGTGDPNTAPPGKAESAPAITLRIPLPSAEDTAKFAEGTAKFAEGTAKFISRAATGVGALTSRVKLPNRANTPAEGTPKALPSTSTPDTPAGEPVEAEEGVDRVEASPVAEPVAHVTPAVTPSSIPATGTTATTPKVQPAPSSPVRSRGGWFLPLLVVVGGALLTITSVWMMARQLSGLNSFDPDFNPAVATDVASLRVTSTAEANATSTAYAHATATTVAVSSLTSGFANATMVPYGLPGDGEMVYYAGYERTSSSYAYMQNFVTMVTMQNPDAASTSWSYGIIFREQSLGEQYRLVLTHQRTWFLYWYVDDTEVDPIATGTLPDAFNVSPNGTNLLTLVVTGNRARFWVNETQAADLNVSSNNEEGSIRLGSFFREGDGAEGAVVRYKGMQVWELRNQ